MHEVLVTGLGGPSLPRKSVVRLTDRPDMTLDVYRGRKTTKQQQQKMEIDSTDGNCYNVWFWVLIGLIFRMFEVHIVQQQQGG